jgi:superfamily I DNA/RNA helicase
MLFSVASRMYEQRMHDFHAVDFDSMLSLAHKVLYTSEEALAIARAQYQHLLVDEFQVRWAHLRLKAWLACA